MPEILGHFSNDCTQRMSFRAERGICFLRQFGLCHQQKSRSLTEFTLSEAEGFGMTAPGYSIVKNGLAGWIGDRSRPEKVLGSGLRTERFGKLQQESLHDQTVIGWRGTQRQFRLQCPLETLD